jgi:hypothetical protein
LALFLQENLYDLVLLDNIIIDKLVYQKMLSDEVIVLMTEVEIQMGFYEVYKVVLEILL